MLTVAMVLLPETPYWLIEYNQFEKAKKSLRFFRGSKYDINPEFNEIHQNHQKYQNYYHNYHSHHCRNHRYLVL